MSSKNPTVRLGGTMRRAPVRGADPTSRGAKAYVNALRRLGVDPSKDDQSTRDARRAS